MYQSNTEGKVIKPAKEATRMCRPPPWAAKHRNLPFIFSFCHYFGVVAINDSIIEALLDLGGAKLLVDVDTTE